MTLSWSARSDATVNISGVGPVAAGNSSVVVNPTESTTYTLTSVSGEESESAEVSIKVQRAGVLYGLLDLGATGGTVEAGALTGTQIGAATHNENTIDYPLTNFTSATGDEFTLTIDNVAPNGSPLGGIDWRDRGDSSGDKLTALGEDLLKNNAGMIRVTLGGLAAGSYDIISWHFDPLASQAEKIAIFVTDANGTALNTGIIGSAAADPIISSINNTEANMISHSVLFTVDSNGTDDVIIYFDARGGLDIEVPLNGLEINSIGGGGPPRITTVEIDATAKTATFAFTSVSGAEYALFGGLDLVSFPNEIKNSISGDTGTTTVTVPIADPLVASRQFYRVERMK